MQMVEIYGRLQWYCCQPDTPIRCGAVGSWLIRLEGVVGGFNRERSLFEFLRDQEDLLDAKGAASKLVSQWHSQRFAKRYLKEWLSLQYPDHVPFDAVPYVLEALGLSVELSAQVWCACRDRIKVRVRVRVRGGRGVGVG